LSNSDAVLILNALSDQHFPQLASPLFGWVFERARCAATRKSHVAANPVKYFLKAARNFMTDSGELAAPILDRYDGFAETHGFAYCGKIKAWTSIVRHECPVAPGDWSLLLDAGGSIPRVCQV
jgi:hypothetical protein